MVVYLGDAVARVYITHKHIKNALKEAGLEVKKGPRRLPERNCDGIPVQSNRIQTRCVPIGYNDGTPLEEALANFEWPYKLRVTLKFQDQDEQDQDEKLRLDAAGQADALEHEEELKGTTEKGYRYLRLQKSALPTLSESIVATRQRTCAAKICDG